MQLQKEILDIRICEITPHLNWQKLYSLLSTSQIKTIISHNYK